MRPVLSLVLFFTVSIFSATAHAGFQGYNQGVSLKVLNAVDCVEGLSCSKIRNKFTISKVGGLEALVAATATTITTSQCGSTFYNSGAVAMVLPAIASSNLGCRLTFVTMNAAAFSVDPSGTDQILALTDAAGDKISNATLGNSVTLQAMASGKWAAVAIYGTYTDAN